MYLCAMPIEFSAHVEQDGDYQHRSTNTRARMTPIPRDWRQFRQAPSGAHETLHPAWSRKFIGSLWPTFRSKFSF